MASCTLILIILLSRARHCCENTLCMRSIFVMQVLHCLWFSDEYPKLRYTHKDFLGIKLFKLVPCAWLATVCAISCVIPVWALVFDDEGTLWERGNRIVKAIPNITIAAWAFGKTYMAAANATAEQWLLDDEVY